MQRSGRTAATQAAPAPITHLPHLWEIPLEDKMNNVQLEEAALRAAKNYICKEENCESQKKHITVTGVHRMECSGRKYSSNRSGILRTLYGTGEFLSHPGGFYYFSEIHFRQAGGQAYGANPRIRRGIHFFLKFFDRKAFIIMAFMMSGGIGLRASGVAPERFIAVFYTGLGAALLLAGILFGVQYITGFRLFEKDKLQGEE